MQLRRVLDATTLCTLVALLVLHLALRGSNADLDANAYLDWYWEVRKLTREQFFNELSDWYSTSITLHSFEWGFALWGWALAHIGASEAMFFGLTAALSLGLKLRPLMKYCPSPVLGLLWYVSWYFILMEMNAIRVAVAAGFLLTATASMLEGRRWRFVIYVFLAASFHISAFIGLLFPLLRSERIGRKVLIGLLVASIALGYIDLVPVLGFLGNWIPKLTEYVTFLTVIGLYEEINRFNTISLIRLALAAVLIWKLPFFASRSMSLTVGVRAYVVAQAIYYAFASFPVVGSRLSQLMGVLDLLVVPAIATILRPRSFWLPAYLLICALQFYALALHFRLADFFYFIGEPKVVIP